MSSGAIRLELVPDVLEDATAGRLDLPKALGEARPVAEPRISGLQSACCDRRRVELTHQVDLGAVGRSPGEPLERMDVALVRGEYEVEIGELGGIEATCPVARTVVT